MRKPVSLISRCYVASGIIALLLLPVAAQSAEQVAVAASAESVAPASSVGAADTAQGELPDSLWSGNERVRKVLKPTDTFSKAEPFELMQGGKGTQKTHIDRNAYSQETGTLDFEQLQLFKVGNALFNKMWVSSPSSTLASDGLGPFYSARACQACHMKDGRGQLPKPGEKAASLVLQLKHEQNSRWGADPTYGLQFHTSAVPGIEAEGLVSISTSPLLKKFTDGTTHTLKQPTYTLEQLAYGPLHQQTVASPRLATAMHGLGLLEAISESDILAYADPEDADADGISGRANWQSMPDGSTALGRFGHKATMSTVREQSLHALFTDMGLSTARLPDPQADCMSAQSDCKSLPHGDQSGSAAGEVPDTMLDLITFYAQNLAVPARRDVSAASVLRGKSLFYDSGCIGCHVPKHVTSREADLQVHQYQLIWPYTDLLLHDMGEALADHAGDGDANGREWRTAPLWGIGLAQTVNPQTTFLHDGRASTLLEAVLWHGGEAQSAVNQVLSMNKSQRDDLIRFLESL